MRRLTAYWNDNKDDPTFWVAVVGVLCCAYVFAYATMAVYMLATAPTWSCVPDPRGADLPCVPWPKR